MNRQEAIDSLREIAGNGFDIKQVTSGFLREIANILEQPTTLSEFLGWEENSEYKNGENHVCKISDGQLYTKAIDKDDWYKVTFQWNESNIKEFRECKKVEPKLKAWHVKDEYSFNELKKEHDHWYDFINSCDNYIYERKLIDGGIVYSWTDNLKEIEDTHEIIEYHKEEPLYYAKIKGTQVDIRGVHGLRQKFTIRSWVKLGINNTNVDFERAE